MKRFVQTFIVMVAICTAMPLMAETYKREFYDNGWRTITWTYTVDREPYSEWEDGEATLTAVSGLTGDVTIPTIEINDGSTWDEYGNYIENTRRYRITRIGSNAFSGCTKITSISMPSVREIGSRAFFGCTKLATVEISSDLSSVDRDAFEGCSSLTSFRESGDFYSYYKVRNGLLFYSYDNDVLFLVPSGLTDVRIPEGTHSISGDAFYCCRNLKTISVPRSLRYVNSDVFYNSALPSTIYFDPGDGMRVKELFRNACYSLPDSAFVQKKKDSYRELYPLFGDGIYDWTIDDTVSYDNGGVSYRSASVNNANTYITFTVENIKSLNWMWKKSSDYDDLNCYIDDNYAGDCSSAKWQKFSYEFHQDWGSNGYSYGTHTVRIEYENWGWGDEASANCAWIDGLIVTNSFAEAPWTSEQRGDGRLWITGTTNTTGTVEIPSALDGKAVVGIGDWLFECCSGLTSVTIPEGITDIGTGAFSGCTVLRKIDIPTTVCNVGSNVFYGCSNLTNINVVAGNQFYCEYGGALFTKDMTELLFVPRGIATITIPSSVVNISTNAFKDAASLTTLNVEIGDEERIKGLVASSGTSVDSLGFRQCCARVVFDPNGGPGSVQSQLVIIGELGNLPFPAQRNGYMFTGWFTARNGGTEIHSASVSTFNVGGETPFYAHWEPITWLYVSNSDGTLTVTGCCPTAYGNVFIPPEIDGYAVTKIGDRAFYGRTGLTGVTLASGITAIGSEAFGGCSSLHEVNLPENVEFTGSSPFAGTAYLDSLPNGFLLFGKFLLGYKGGCPSSITVPEGVECICDSAFSDKNISTVTFPSSLKRIGKSAFYRCSMTTLTLPEGLQVIDDDAFAYIDSLATVNFPRTLKRIGMYAFAKSKGYYAIRRIDIEAEDLYIGHCAFYCGEPFNSYYTGQGEISLRGSGIKVGDSAFYGYQYAYGLTIDLAGVSEVGNYAFGKAGYCQMYRYSDDGGWYAQGCVTVKLSDELKEVSTNAFDWAAVGTICVDKEETIFSRSGWLNIISKRALVGYSNEGYYCVLKIDGNYVGDIQIPAGCTSVPPCALMGIRLSTISIPSSVTNIGESAFACCHGLTNVTFSGNSPNVGSSAFAGVVNCVACVPKGSTGWGVEIPGTWNGMAIQYRTDSVVVFNLTDHGKYISGGELEQTVDYQEAAVAPEVAANEGWEFLGWDADFSCVISNMTVNALWRRVYTTGEAIGADAASAALPWEVGTNGVAEAKGYEDATATGGKSAKFMAADDASVWVEAVVTNACRVSFDWTTSCEGLVKGKPYDYLSFAVDGEQQNFICGETGWTSVTNYVTGEGEHHLRWTFMRDEDGSSGEDCAWLANVKVSPSVTLTFAAGGATEGTVPEPMTAYADESIVLPGQGSLAWPKHTFLGWSDGATQYAAGAEYSVGAVAVAGRPLCLTAVWEANVLSAPVITAPETYEAESCVVTVTADGGATIFYTTDGTEPGAARSASAPYQWIPATLSTIQYQGAFTVTGSATIKAITVRDDYYDSEVASATVTRLTWTFGEYLNWPEQTFTTGGDAGWTRVKGVSADGYALRSGAITHSQTSRLETVVSGPGTITFSCKVAGEIVKRIVFDGLAFCIDGIQQGDLMGDADWAEQTFEVTGEGSHTLSWLYVKDEDGSVGEDCAWVDGVTWTPTGVPVDMGGGKSVTVPETWIEEHPALVAAAGGDAEAALQSTAANGRLSNVECYILGLDPESTTNDFKIISLPLKADGTPDLENIVFDPPEARWNVEGARPVVKGAASLDSEWQAVTEENKASFRFFKVEVVLP